DSIGSAGRASPGPGPASWQPTTRSKHARFAERIIIPIVAPTSVPRPRERNNRGVRGYSIARSADALTIAPARSTTRARPDRAKPDETRPRGRVAAEKRSKGWTE